MIYKGGSGEIVEKKSRFIANVCHVVNEEQAVTYINNIKKQFYDARHNCYAYVCGENNQIQRFSDDGEPSGTAGKPILDIIISAEITNCLIVVTRYFGGTLLGTGGLIRAYQASAKAGIECSNIVEVYEGIKASIDTDYNNIGKLQYICGELGVDIYNTEYTENVHIEVVMENEKYSQFLNKIKDTFFATVNIYDIISLKFCKTKEKDTILIKNCE